MNTEHLDTSQITLTDIGRQLKLARERSQKSLENAAADLRLSTSLLHEIETDLENCHVKPVYLCGYLRNYAKLVQVNQRVIDLALPLLGVEQEIPAPIKRTPINVSPFTRRDKHIRRIATITGSAVVILIILWSFIHSRNNTATLSQTTPDVVLTTPATITNTTTTPAT